MQHEHPSCPAYEAIQILQEKWTMHIIRILLEAPRGFNELRRDIGGCNPTTLSQRLERLERLGLVHKDVQSQMPPRVCYTLNESGRSLHTVIDAIDTWARRHLPACVAHEAARLEASAQDG